MTDITLIGLMSTWREGRLSLLAHRSLLEAELDGVYVFEGPAGKDTVPPEAPLSGFSDTWYRMSGETDADKRTRIVEWAKAKHPQRPLWAVWLDGDEILMNGRYLRDVLQRWQWADEEAGVAVDADEGQTASYPLIQVEHDGSLGRASNRCVRLDLIRRYVVSIHVIEWMNGAVTQHGNPRVSIWDLPQGHAVKLDEANRERAFVSTLLGCEPYTVHRPQYRHPARAGVRLHKQELVELERLGFPTGENEGPAEAGPSPMSTQ